MVFLTTVAAPLSSLHLAIVDDDAKRLPLRNLFPGGE
jgi:hypothetical protein